MKASTIKAITDAVQNTVKIDYVSDYYPFITNNDEVIKAITTILDAEGIWYETKDSNVYIHSAPGTKKLEQNTRINLSEPMRDYFSYSKFIYAVSRPRVKKASTKITKRVIYNKARELVRDRQPVGTQTLVADYNGAPATIQEFDYSYLITLTKKDGRKEFTSWAK
ncbi:hypothetical protein [Leuconostoc pseudomesenteroides]|uniref:hypothetical protein n=1 Tax=Leuconostoc pseudomesenteroides TaxID=33968 RepID=UPI0039E7A653